MLIKYEKKILKVLIKLISINKFATFIPNSMSIKGNQFEFDSVSILNFNFFGLDFHHGHFFNHYLETIFRLYKTEVFNLPDKV